MNRQFSTAAMMLVAILLSAGLFNGCGEKKKEKPTEKAVKIVVGTNSPGIPNAKARFKSPKPGSVLKDNKVSVEVEVLEYELGGQTETRRAAKIANSGEGQHVHIIVDNQPYFACYEAGKPFEIGELSEGAHSLVVFPSRSYHESVKNPDALDILNIYVGKKTGDFMLNEDDPAIIYSRPKGEYKGADATRIMLDFYLHNVTLSPDGYKARYTIDGKYTVELTEWIPAYVKFLPPGDHTVLLELIDKDGNPVPGAFNKTERTIKVTAEEQPASK